MGFYKHFASNYKIFCTSLALINCSNKKHFELNSCAWLTDTEYPV